jgi:peptide deformylase
MKILDYRKHSKQLRRPNRLVTPEELNTEEFKNNLRTMTELLKQDGVGLAASQIGWNVKLFILCLDDSGKDSDVRVFLNPRIINISKAQDKMQEGCLSFPGLYLDVKRPTSIEWEYDDLNWQRHTEKANNFFARAALHETDHCDSRVFIDYATSVQKLKVNRWLKDTDMLK